MGVEFKIMYNVAGRQLDIRIYRELRTVNLPLHDASMLQARVRCRIHLNPTVAEPKPSRRSL